jgi:uncharacterized membrane protein
LPNAGTRGSFILVHAASQARDLAVGRTIDENRNLLPAIWTNISTSRDVDVLPLPAGNDPALMSGSILGRATDCNPSGTVIAGQVSVNGQMEGARWSWDGAGGSWQLTTTGPILDVEADYLETWVYGVSDSGTLVVGWVDAYYDGFDRLETTPFVWEDGVVTILPVPPGTVSAGAEVVTPDGSQVAGSLLTADGSYIALWEKDSGGAWAVSTVAPPMGHANVDVFAYIDGSSRKLSLFVENSSGNLVSLVYIPGSGYVETATWMLTEFGASYGDEWTPMPYYANPSTGVSYGMLRSDAGNVMAYAVLPPPPAFSLTINLRDAIGRWRPVGTDTWLNSGDTHVVAFGGMPPLTVEFEPVPGYWTPRSYNFNQFSPRSQTLDFAYFSDPSVVSPSAAVDLISKGQDIRTEVRGGYRDGSLLTGTYLTASNTWVPYAWTNEGGMVDLPTLPGAGSRNSFLTAAGASLEASTIVGRAIDPNDNLVPVIWTYDAGEYTIHPLPLSPTIDPSLFTFETLGRALFINQKGDTIIGQTLTNSGHLEGALWHYDGVSSQWVLQATTGTAVFATDPDLMFVWPYALSEDGNVIAGWASIYSEGFTVFEEKLFTWDGQNVSLLPVQPDADSSSLDTISGDGQQIAGVSSVDGLHSLSLWNRTGDGTWEQTIIAPPAGYPQFTPQNFINPFSKTISGYTFDGMGFEQWMYIPGDGYLPTADWVHQHFEVSFGTEWMPEIIFADLATGLAYGRISTYGNHMMGYRISDPPTGQLLESARFMRDLQDDMKGPLDENGPLSVPNIIAHALGLHPHHITKEHLPSASMLPNDGQPVVSSYIPLNKAATDVAIIPEVSSTMAPDDWHSDPDNLSVVETADGIQVIDKVPFSPTQPRFLRFRVVPVE